MYPNEVNTIHFSLANGATFSIASIHYREFGFRCEVAVFNDDGFIPVAIWFYGNDKADDDNPILPIGDTASDLDDALDTAIKWAKDEKDAELARALDQAL